MRSKQTTGRSAFTQTIRYESCEGRHRPTAATYHQCKGSTLSWWVSFLVISVCSRLPSIVNQFVLYSFASLSSATTPQYTTTSFVSSYSILRCFHLVRSSLAREKVTNAKIRKYFRKTILSYKKRRMHWKNTICTFRLPSEKKFDFVVSQFHAFTEVRKKRGERGEAGRRKEGAVR